MKNRNIEAAYEQGRINGIAEAQALITKNWLNNPFFKLKGDEDKVIKIIIGQLEDIKCESL